MCVAGGLKIFCRYLLIPTYTGIYVDIAEEGISSFSVVWEGALFFLISNLYRFIIAVLLFSAFCYRLRLLWLHGAVVAEAGFVRARRASGRGRG